MGIYPHFIKGSELLFQVIADCYEKEFNNNNKSRIWEMDYYIYG